MAHQNPNLKESNKNFPYLQWNQNLNPPQNCEVKHAKHEATPPPFVFEPLSWALQMDVLRECVWGLKGEAWSFGYVEHETGIKAIKKGVGGE